MILNIATIAACFLMLVIFRRFDRANPKMAKLRRYSSRVFDDFSKMAEKENRKFQDATIEIDILIKKSGALAKNMADAIREIEDRLKGLDVEKTNLKKVEEDLKVVSTAAKDVNKQIQFISSAKENFSDMVKRVTFLSENVDNLNSQLNLVVAAYEDRVRDKSRELSEEFSGRLIEMEGKISDSGNLIYENFKMKMSPLIKAVDGADNLNKQIENLRETLYSMENSFFDQFGQKSRELRTDINDNIDKLMLKLKNVELNIDESKGKLITTFEDEASRIRAEFDSLNIHTVSKKDEVVQAARREAESIRKRIDEFEDRFIELENRIVASADDKLNNMESAYQSIELRINTLAGRLKDEEVQASRRTSEQNVMLQKSFGDLESRLSEIKNEIIRYEQNHDVFGKVDTMMKRADESIAQFMRVIDDSRKETRELQKFVSDLDQIRELKKTADKEIRSYYARKEKLADIEGDVRSLMEANETVLNKSDRLLENVVKIDAVNARIDALSDMHMAVEKKINELSDFEELISRNLDSVNKSNIVLQSMDSRLKTYEKVIEKSDKRLEKLGVHMKRFEEETLELKIKESEMRELKDRLSELDSLSEHMEERIKQIHAMFQKVEAIRRDIDVTDSKLQDMFNQTDMKMREFSDFIQAVDNNNPILKQVKPMPSKNLSENIVKTVRELSNKGWEPEDISKKLLIDENSVRFIINTTLI